jgi:hypothetical protein
VITEQGLPGLFEGQPDRIAAGADGHSKRVFFPTAPSTLYVGFSSLSTAAASGMHKASKQAIFYSSLWSLQFAIT